MEGPETVKEASQQEPSGGVEHLREELQRPPLRDAEQARKWAKSIANLLKKVRESGHAVAALAEGLPKVSHLQRQELARETRSPAVARLLIQAAREWPSPLAERFCFEVGRTGSSDGVPLAAEALARRATPAALLALEGIAERSDLGANQRSGVQDRLREVRKAPRPEEVDIWSLGLGDGAESSRVADVLSELGHLSLLPLLDQYLALRVLDQRHRLAGDPGSRVDCETDAERLSHVDPSFWTAARLRAWPPDLLSWFLVKLLEQEAGLERVLESLGYLDEGEAPHGRVISRLQDLTRRDLIDPETKSHQSRALKAAAFLLSRKLHDEGLPVRLVRWWASLGAERTTSAGSKEIPAIAASFPAQEFRRFWIELSLEPRKDILKSLSPERLEEAAEAETALERRTVSRLDLLDAFWNQEGRPPSLEILTWQIVLEEVKRDQLSRAVLDRCGEFLRRAHLQARFQEAALEVLSEDRLRGDTDLLLDWVLDQSGVVRRVETLTDWLGQRPGARPFVERLARELEDFTVPLEVAGSIAERLDGTSVAALHECVREAHRRLDRERASLETRLATAAEQAEREVAGALEPLLARLRDQWEVAPRLQEVLSERMKALQPQTPSAPEAAPAPHEVGGRAEVSVEDLRGFLATRWRKFTGLALPDLAPATSTAGLVQILLAQVRETPDCDDILRDVAHELVGVCGMAGAREARGLQAVALARGLSEASTEFRSALGRAEEIPSEFQAFLGQGTGSPVEPTEESPDFVEDVCLLQDRRSTVNALSRQYEGLTLQARRRAAQTLRKATEEFEDLLCHYLEFRRALSGLGLEPVTEELLATRVRAELTEGYRILQDGKEEGQVFQVRTMGLKVRGDVETAVPAVLVPLRDH